MRSRRVRETWGSGSDMGLICGSPRGSPFGFVGGKNRVDWMARISSRGCRSVRNERLESLHEIRVGRAGGKEFRRGRGMSVVG